MKQCTACKSCIYAYFCLQIGFFFQLVSLLPQFLYILQLICQFFFYFFFALAVFTVQIFTYITEFITFTLTITGIPNKFFITHSFINQFFTFTPAFVIIPALFIVTLGSNLHLHLHVSCHSIYLVSLVLEIRLNTLTFKFFITSGTQIVLHMGH